MMKRSLLLIYLIISFFVAESQSITGTILDLKSKKPVSGVHVYLSKSGKGTISDEDGKFILKKPIKISEFDTVIFSHVLYETKKISIPYLTKNNINIIYLSIAKHKIDEVTIVPKHSLKTQINFKNLTSLKHGVYAFGALLFEDKIWIIGGDESFLEDVALKALYYGATFEKITGPNFSWEDYNGNAFIYNTKTDKWEFPNINFRERAYHNILYYKNKIYVLGGKRLSANRLLEYLDDKIEVYDIKNDTIIVDDTNPHQAANFSFFVYDNKIIVFGGSTKLKKDGQKVYSNEVHLYDLETGYWYLLTNMPEAKETKGILIKDKIYFIGGFNFQALRNIETYDLTTGIWNTEGKLFYGIERPALTYHDDIIYIFEDERIFTYNIKEKELKEYIINLNLKYSEMFYVNNKLYLIGGSIEDDFVIMPSSGFYSIDLNEFEETEINKTKKF